MKRLCIFLLAIASFGMLSAQDTSSNNFIYSQKLNPNLRHKIRLLEKKIWEENTELVRLEQERLRDSLETIQCMSSIKRTTNNDSLYAIVAHIRALTDTISVLTNEDAILRKSIFSLNTKLLTYMTGMTYGELLPNSNYDIIVGKKKHTLFFKH